MEIFLCVAEHASKSIQLGFNLMNSQAEAEPYKRASIHRSLRSKVPFTNNKHE